MAKSDSPRRFVAPAVAVALLALLVGAACTSDDRASTGSARMADTDEALSAAPTAGAARSALASGQAATDAEGGSGGGGATQLAAGGDKFAREVLPQSVSQPQVVRTAVLRVEVEKGAFRKAFSNVATIASALGGFVASSTSAAGDDDGGSGSLVVRVPADRFDEARRQLHELGTLESEQLSGEDVSGQLTDLDARLRNLRAQEEAIRALMGKAKDVNETLAVQNQLGAVREQIEQLAAQQARLADAAAMSTITVEVFEPGAAARGDERSPIAKAFAKAVEAAEDVVAGTIVALGYLVPLALLLLAAFVAGRALLAVRARAAVARTGGDADPAPSAG